MELYKMNQRHKVLLASVSAHELSADHLTSDVVVPPLMTVHMTSSLSYYFHTPFHRLGV